MAKRSGELAIDIPVPFPLTYWMEIEDGQFSVHCPELGVASCADTSDQAVEYIKEAVTLYLETLEELGEKPKRLTGADPGRHV